jgi:hypothetical protein
MVRKMASRQVLRRPQPRQFSSQPSPFAILDQIGRETVQKAQEAAQTVQAIAEQATTSGPAGALNELQGVARSNASEIGKVVVPLFSAFLILARANGPLTIEHETKLGQTLPDEAVDVLRNLVEIIPEEPKAKELKRIADTLEKITAQLDALTPKAEVTSAAEPPSASASAPGVGVAAAE